MVVLVALAGYLIAYAAAPLFLVLPHELGHALAALALGSCEARVEIGAPSRRLHLRIGRLRLEVRPLSGRRWMWFGRAWSDVGDRCAARVAVVAAGPAVTLVLAIFYVSLGVDLTGVARMTLFFLAASALVNFVVTAAPLRYGAFFGPYAGSTSDGRKIVELLRSRRTVMEPRQQV